VCPLAKNRQAEVEQAQQALDLDGKYAAFGKVVDDVSLKTVQAIGAVAVGANNRPRDKVTIQKAVVHETAR